MTRSTDLAASAVSSTTSVLDTIVVSAVSKAIAAVLERLADRGEVGGRAGDPPGVALVDDVLGPGVERREHDVVLAHRPRHDDDALALELPGHRTGLGDGAAQLLQQRADVAAGAVAVVGEHLDEHGHAVGGVALVGDLLVGDALELAGAPLDGPLDRVERHRGVAGLLVHGAQRRVHVGVAAALARRHLDLADQLGEELPAALSAAPFLCLIVAHLE